MSSLQPPHPGPQPPAPDENEPITGVHPATRDFVREVNKSGLFKVSWALIAWVGLVGVGSVTGWRAVAGEAHDAGAAAVLPFETRLKAVEQVIPQLRDEVYEGRKDTRELQNVVLTRKRSERLDEPLAPPQVPDAGVPKRVGR